MNKGKLIYVVVFTSIPGLIKFLRSRLPASRCTISSCRQEEELEKIAFQADIAVIHWTNEGSDLISDYICRLKEFKSNLSIIFSVNSQPQEMLR